MIHTYSVSTKMRSLPEIIRDKRYTSCVMLTAPYKYKICISVWIKLSFRLEEIGAAAAKEYSLEKALSKMKAEWKDMTFEFVPYRDSVSTSVCHLCVNNIYVQC